jgi:hypothetical protein
MAHMTPQPLRVQIAEAGAVAGGMTPIPVPLHVVNITPGTAIASEVAMLDDAGNLNFPVGTSISVAGSALTAAGVSTTTASTEAELDTLHGVTPGTVVAGKAVVTTTNKHIDTLVVSDGGLKLGSGAGTAISATAAELNYAADVSLSTQELTASGAVAATTKYLELKHGTVPIAATVATSVAHAGLFTVKNTSASGIAAHTVTLTAGTWDGVTTIATFAVAASLQCLVVVFDSAGNGTVISNTGTVVLS